MRRAVAILLVLAPLCLMAQRQTMVYLERCRTLSFDEQRHPDAQLLSGDVVFRHDSAYMYCDSAYFYEKTNSLDAFGHVRFVQGDTLSGYGDVLYYDGNRRFANLRHNVRLEHYSTILSTDSLNYDRERDIAWYFNGGTIEDSLNVLKSEWGQYTPYDNQAVFRQHVDLVNDKFTLSADSLYYNTSSNVADLVGPTDIIYEEDTHIFSTRGWYNTKTEYSMLLDRSVVNNVDGQSLTGDTIYYDKQDGIGKAMGNIEMKDTVEKITLYGNYCEAYEKEEYGFATDSALLVDWSEDDYTYMHADTLFTIKVPERLFSLVPRDSILVDSVLTAQAPDTVWRDTSYHLVKAYYGVRVYRYDVQAVCDSLVYLSKDSTMQMTGNPVCWNDDSQMSADQLTLYIKNGEVDYLHGVGNAIAVQQESTIRFDQLAGKELFGYIDDGALRQIYVKGNAQTIVFPKEDDGSFVGMNRTESSYVRLYIKDKKIDRVVFTTATSGSLYPLDQLSDADAHLSSFFWAELERPYKPGDVFLKPERTKRPEAAVQTASAADNTANTDRNKKNNDRKRTSAK